MKTSMAVLLTILIMLGLAGGGYYYMNKQNTADKATLQSQIDDLTAKLAAEKTASTVATATADATANWKTYTDSINKYTIKYSATWAYDGTTPGTVTFRRSAGEHWMFEIQASTTQKTLQQSVTSEKTKLETGGSTVTVSDTTISGQPASKLIVSASSAATTTEHIVVYNEKLYIINLSENNNTDLSNMLSTFQFTK